jgi:hypothetical protein
METGADDIEGEGCNSEEMVLDEGGSADADRLFRKVREERNSERVNSDKQE